MPIGAKSDRNPTDWGNSQRVGVDMTDEEWADLGTLIAMRTPAGERPSYGRFIATVLKENFASELAFIAQQRRELAAKIKGA
jgi:hypothetical protein